MGFLGLRPFKILVSDNKILVFCPYANCVFAKDDVCYKRDAEVFAEIPIDKDLATKYVVTLCLNVSDVSYPLWYVATSYSDFNNVITRKIGSVEWDGSSWVITQDEIGRQVFDIKLFTEGTQYGLTGVISDDLTSIVCDDGRIFPTGFSEYQIENGLTPEPGTRVTFNYIE